VEGLVNGRAAYFLIDTGASVGLMDYDQRKDYDLEVGRKFSGTVVGAGGEMRGVKHCNTFVHMEDKVIPQFLLADISEVVKSIKRETGIEILGIISLPQMKMCGIQIDANDNLIIIE
jgi:predicted aspartyl protease